MKKFFTVLLAAMFLFCAAGCAREEKGTQTLSVRVMTHNMRYASNATDTDYGDLRADERMQAELDFIEKQNCDIVFLNEAGRYQDEILQAQLDSMGYGYVRESDFADGIYNYNGTNANLYSQRFCNYILYRKDIFTLKDTMSFSLSDSPADPHAPFSGMSYEALWEQEGRPRTAVWALLTHSATGAEILAACAHAQWVTDDNGTDWNAEGLKVLAQQIEKARGYYPAAHVVFGGDFNSEHITAFDNDSYRGVNADATYKTYGDTALDHIYYSAEGICKSAGVAGNTSLSDHLALWAMIELSVQ